MIHPTEVDAEWSIITNNEGNKLLQVSTFGSDTRASLPKVSQTIQLDASMAKILRAALTATFGPESV